MKTPLLSVIAALCSSGAGFFVGGGKFSSLAKSSGVHPNSQEDLSAHEGGSEADTAKKGAAAAVEIDFAAQAAQAEVAALSVPELLKRGRGLVEQQKFLLAKIAATPPEGMVDLLTALHEIPDQYLRRASREVGIEKWLGIDQKAATDFCLEHDGASLMDSLRRVWVKKDLSAALEWTATLSGNKGKQEAISLMDELSRQKPLDYIQRLSSMPQDHISSQAVSRAVEALAKTDLAGAQAFLATQASGSVVGPATAALAQQWGRTNGTAAFAWASGLTDPTQKVNALREVLGSWAAIDPELAAARYIEVKDLTSGSFTTGSAVSAIVSGLAKADPQEAMAFALQHGKERDRANLLSAIVGQVDEIKPSDYVQMLNTMQITPRPQTAYNSYYSDDDTSIISFDGESPWNQNVKNKWQAKDPGAAWTEVSSLAESPARMKALEEVAKQLVFQDPAKASQMMASATEEQKQILGRALLPHLQNTGDIGSVMEAAQSLEGGQRSALLAAMAGQVALTDPLKALDLVGQLAAAKNTESQSMTKEQMQSNAQARVLAQWATYDVNAAISWATGQPEADQGPALSAIVGTWTNRDSYAASQWVAQLPAGGMRDDVVASLASSLSGNDVPSAVTWASSIQDETKRSAALQNVIQIQAYSNPAKARELLNTLQLPADFRQRIEANMVRYHRFN